MTNTGLNGRQKSFFFSPGAKKGMTAPPVTSVLMHKHIHKILHFEHVPTKFIVTFSRIISRKCNSKKH